MIITELHNGRWKKKRMDVLEKWFNKKVNTYYIMVDDEYKSCPEMAKWLSATASGR